MAGAYDYLDDFKDEVNKLDKQSWFECEACISKAYQSRRIILGGGKVSEIMEATGFSREEAQRIYDEEVGME